tara:strand:- start:59 stop:319 length:261 start_codon:yes stop_codon:yes gene_type:complete
MNFSSYPIQSPPFYKNKTVNVNKEVNCIASSNDKKECNPNVMNGYHKPLNESCPPITIQQNEMKIDDNCTSIWNNMTKRKSLVKDY